jgi:hypothetical protein
VTPKRPLRLATLAAAAAAVLLVGCGGGGGSAPTAAAGPPTTTAGTLPTLDGPEPTAVAPAPRAPEAPDGRSVLPDLVVDDVGAGTKVDLASLVPSPQPVLLWFWAPH